MPEFNRWFSDKAEHLRYDYDAELSSESIVVDLGLYHGDFSELISKKYNCYVYGFEPIKEFFNLSEKKLANFSKIKLFNYAVGNSDRIDKISLDMDGSSICKKGKNLVDIHIKSFESVLNELNLSQVDLLKINVEGCEYEILDHILDKNLIKLFKNIQVQFHDFVPNAIQKRNQIVEKLKITHTPTYLYEFVWENYKCMKKIEN